MIPERFLDLFENPPWRTWRRCSQTGRRRSRPCGSTATGPTSWSNVRSDRLKNKNMRQNPAVALDIVDPDNLSATFPSAAWWSRSRSAALLIT